MQASLPGTRYDVPDRSNPCDVADLALVEGIDHPEFLRIPPERRHDHTRTAFRASARNT